MNKKGFITEYENELHGIWGSQRMIDYCVKKVDNVVRLDNGFLIPIDKEHIEKDFCFGYHDSRYNTDDYDRANAMAAHARTSEEYFFDENMRGFREVMNNLDDNDLYPVVSMMYYSGGDANKIKSFRFLRGWQICELFGGSCYLSEIGGKYVKDRDGHTIYILNEKDIASVKAGYELAMKNHEKRVRTYLKKYGTKHVNAWSYWLDA